MAVARLGIDFGTTRTVVAAALDGRYPVAQFERATGARAWMPGLVARTPEGLVYGWDAEAHLADPSAHVVRSIKRALTGLAPDDEVPGLGASALAVLTGFLEALRVSLLREGNLPIAPDARLEAHVAVPAAASSAQRYLTLEAFARAGFEVRGLLNEPTAAAIEHAQNHLSTLGGRSPKRYLLVYDLGGGTFDTSAVSLAGRRFELLATEGLGQLGGDDFDAILLDLALEAAGIERAQVSARAWPALLEAAREAKEGARPSSRRLLVDLGAHDVGVGEVAVAVAALHERARPLVERTVELVDALLARLAPFGIDPKDPRELAALYLVGGAAAFAPVGKLLRERFGRKVLLAPEPHAATAVGLAIAADPSAGVRVEEAVTRHFGVWREAREGRDKRFDPILTKDARAGVEGGALVVERRYRAAHTIGHLRFVECTELDAAGQPAGDLHPFCEVRFPYDPALAGRDALDEVPVERLAQPARDEIVERYEYRNDGTIVVRIENRSRGYARELVASLAADRALARPALNGG